MLNVRRYQLLPDTATDGERAERVNLLIVAGRDAEGDEECCRVAAGRELARVYDRIGAPAHFYAWCKEHRVKGGERKLQELVDIGHSTDPAARNAELKARHAKAQRDHVERIKNLRITDADRNRNEGATIPLCGDTVSDDDTVEQIEALFRSLSQNGRDQCLEQLDAINKGACK